MRRELIALKLIKAAAAAVTCFSRGRSLENELSGGAYLGVRFQGSGFREEEVLTETRRHGEEEREH